MNTVLDLVNSFIFAFKVCFDVASPPFLARILRVVEADFLQGALGPHGGICSQQ